MKYEIRPPCTEWMEIINGNAFGYNNHKWVEILKTKEIQTLKCEVCGKHNTARFSQDYQQL